MRKFRKLNTSVMVFLLCVLLAFPSDVFAETAASAETAEESGEVSSFSEEENTKEPESTQAGPVWPEFPYDLTAATAIVMDADTKAVLYGKDIHSKRYPASITKILTALVVIEHCDLSEEVYFTKEAVSDLESGAVTINSVEGDVLTVKDCLYALLLRSANEVANALAIHVAGSVPAFCELMNKKAAELGCLNSDFRNPNGLTNENHVTTAYDMALIASACMNSSTFMELESEPERKLSGTVNNPDGLTVTIGHQMFKEGDYYDGRVKAGKTGFTSAAGNTLVTMAEENGRRIVAVVLKDLNPDHYKDTKKLIDFGFANFENITIRSDEAADLLNVSEKLLSDGKIEEGKYELSLWSGVTATVPAGTGKETLSASFRYGVPEGAPEGAIAYLTVSSLGHSGTGAYVINSYKEPDTDIDIEVETGKHDETVKDRDDSNEKPEKESAEIPWKGIVTGAALTAAGIFAFFLRKKKKEEDMRALARRERRKERLQSMNMTEEEFAETVRENREKREKTSGENS